LIRLSVTAAILALMMMGAIIPTQAFATPTAPDAGVGDIYIVSTVSGSARTSTGGQMIIVPAVLELKCRVTEVGERLVLFRIERGTLRLGETTYVIVDGWWRGIYDKGTERSAIEATATDGSGARIHFILYGDDVRHTVGGTYMTFKGGLKDSHGDYWRLNIRAWRFRAT